MKLPFLFEVILGQLYCCKVTAFIVKQVRESAWARFYQPVLSQQLPPLTSSVAGDEDGVEEMKPAASPALPWDFFPFLSLRFEITASSRDGQALVFPEPSLLSVFTSSSCWSWVHLHSGYIL